MLSLPIERKFHRETKIHQVQNFSLAISSIFIFHCRTAFGGRTATQPPEDALESTVTGISVSTTENPEQVPILATKHTKEQELSQKKNLVPLEILDLLTKAAFIFTLLFTATDLTSFIRGAMMKSYQTIGKIW